MPGRDRLFALLGSWAQFALWLALAFLIVVSAGKSLPPANHGRTIRIVAGQLPPHMDHSAEGREAEIIRAALRQAYPDRRIEFHVLPFTRHWAAFKSDDRYDAVATTPRQLALTGFQAREYVRYENGVIYRRADFPRGLGSHPIDLLSGRRVVAFAGAAGILPELERATPRFQSYAEYDDQRVHSIMLDERSVDVVIADRLIVDHYNREVGASSKELVFDPVFCPTPYHLVFRTDEMRNAFDRGLEAISVSGELERINDKYLASAGIVERPRVRLGCS